MSGVQLEDLSVTFLRSMVIDPVRYGIDLGSSHLALTVNRSGASPFLEVLNHFFPGAVTSALCRCEIELCVVRSSDLLGQIYHLLLNRVRAEPVHPAAGWTMYAFEFAGQRAVAAFDTKTPRGLPAALFLSDAGSEFGAVVCSERDLFNSRHLVHAIRDIVVRRAEDHDEVLLHAAAARVRSQGGVLIVGPGCAGKTSLLTHLLEYDSAAFVSNDRVLVNAELCRARSVPLAVTVGHGTIDGTPRLCNALRRAHALTLPQLFAGRWEDLPKEYGALPKVDLTPLEFVAGLGAESVASTGVSLIVFPMLAEKPGLPTLEPLLASETAELLQEACETPNGQILPWVIRRTRPEADVACDAAGACELLANSLPAVRYRWEIGDFAAYRRQLLRAYIQRTIDRPEPQ